MHQRGAPGEPAGRSRRSADNEVGRLAVRKTRGAPDVIYRTTSHALHSDTACPDGVYPVSTDCPDAGHAAPRACIARYREGVRPVQSRNAELARLRLNHPT